MKNPIRAAVAVALVVTSASAAAVSWDDDEESVASREPQAEQASRTDPMPVLDATPGAGDTPAAGAPAPRASAPAPARTGAASGEPLDPAGTAESPADRSYREFYEDGANHL